MHVALHHLLEFWALKYLWSTVLYFQATWIKKFLSLSFFEVMTHIIISLDLCIIISFFYFVYDYSFFILG